MNLLYSPLTDTVWIKLKNGKKEEITQQFFQVVMLWLHQSKTLMKAGKKITRNISSTEGEQEFDISIERKK